MKKFCIGLLIIGLASCTKFLYDSKKIDEKVDKKLYKYADIAHKAEGLCHINFAESETNTLIECFFVNEKQLKQAIDLLKADSEISTDKSIHIIESRALVSTLHYHDSADRKLPMLLGVFFENSIENDDFFVEFSLCGVKLYKKIVGSLSSYKTLLSNYVNGMEAEFKFDRDEDVPIIQNWLIKTNQNKNEFFDRLSDESSFSNRKILVEQYQMSQIWYNNAEIDSAKPVNKGEKCLIQLEKHRSSSRHFDFDAFYSDPATEQLIVEIHQVNLK